MCRHLVWLGAPRSLASLVLEPPFGLLRQSYAPRRQQRGLLNGDGWGVGFFVAQAAEPVRWRSSRPLWNDASFASVAPVLRSGAVVAAVRSATVGMPVDETAAAPFTDGRWLLSHNGRVDRAVIPTAPGAESVCDSALLAAHVFAAGLDDGADSLADVLCRLAAADPAASLNLVLTDGGQVLAVSWGDPMSYLVEPDGVVVASEPWDDDPRWVDVPDHHLLTATAGSIDVTPIAQPSRR